MKFTAYADGQSVVGLSETAQVSTDTNGSFIYGFTEQYTGTPNVQVTALAVNSPVPAANMLVTNSLSATIGTLTTASATVNGTTYPKGYVSGRVYGASALTIAGINLVALTALTNSVTINVMVLGA